MNTPNPLVPQGSLLEEHMSKGKSNLFVAVFTILAIHVVLFAGLLMQGCKREKADTSVARTPTNPPPISASYYTPTSPPPSTPATYTPAALPTVASNEVAIASTPPPATEPAFTEYKVVRGDSLYKIAKDHGITLPALQKANPDLDPRRLQPGQVIQIPPPESAAAPSAPEGALAADGSTSYTVKAGDNLTRIAKNHGISVTTLKAANNLRTDRIQVGQKLSIPAPTPSAAPAPGAAPR